MKRSARFAAVDSSSRCGGGGVVLTVVGSSCRVVLSAAVSPCRNVDVSFSLIVLWEFGKCKPVLVTVMVMNSYWAHEFGLEHIKSQ